MPIKVDGYKITLDTLKFENGCAKDGLSGLNTYTELGSTPESVPNVLMMDGKLSGFLRSFI